MKKKLLLTCCIFSLLIILSFQADCKTFWEEEAEKSTADKSGQNTIKAKQESEPATISETAKTNDSIPKTKEVKKTEFKKKKSSKLKSKPIPEKQTKADKDISKPIEIDDKKNNTSEEPKTDQKTEKEKEKSELKKITDESKEQGKKNLDIINFIQPSVELNKDEQALIDYALTRTEQEQLTILWRATLERNKTIRFIVQKLTPEDKNQKKNQVLSQILNTAIFLPFYALQTVAPTDISSLSSYVGAGLASDLINGKAKKNSDHMQLSQTEMVIMFMMIDQVAERVRQQYHLYKQERTDAALAYNELQEAKNEAAAALNLNTPESKFLSQIRIRQIERELKRINFRMRSSRIILTDLSGAEPVAEVDKLMDKEIATLIDLPTT